MLLDIKVCAQNNKSRSFIKTCIIEPLDEKIIKDISVVSVSESKIYMMKGPR